MWWPVAVTLVLVVAGDGGVSAEPLGCRDQDGAPVDWFVLYKLPRLHNTGIDHVSNGVGYMHFSSASEGERWTMSDVAINSSLSAAGRTLTPIYNKPRRKSLIYVFYNDEDPDGSTSLARGHTKGVVAFDGDSGFWLVHSVPGYPPAPKRQYDYPASGHHYGQSFLCLTLSATQLEKVAQQLLFNEPYIYASQLSSTLDAHYPLMAQVVGGKHRSTPPWYGVAQLVTSGGGLFTSYAKTRRFGKDLYSDFAAPALRTDLLTETWRNGPHPNQMPSNCSLTYSVENVRAISVRADRTPPAAGRVTVKFRSTEDHSKWAVSKEAARPWVCVGDINRMTTQEVRGGGTVCHRSAALWRVFSQLVSQVEPCPARKPINVYRRRP